MEYKIDDLVEETEVIEGFVAVLIKKLRDLMLNQIILTHY